MKSKETVCANLAQALMDYLELICAPRDELEPSHRLYSYDDLADMMGKSKDTIRQWVCAGEFGEPIRVGSSTRVTQEGLDKFIADHSGPTRKMPSRTRTRTTRTITNPLGTDHCPASRKHPTDKGKGPIRIRRQAPRIEATIKPKGLYSL